MYPPWDDGGARVDTRGQHPRSQEPNQRHAAHRERTSANTTLIIADERGAKLLLSAKGTPGAPPTRAARDSRRVTQSRRRARACLGGEAREARTWGASLSQNPLGRFQPETSIPARLDTLFRNRLSYELFGIPTEHTTQTVSSNGHEALQAILRYLSATHERLSPKELYDIVMEAADRKNKKEVFVDLVDYLKHEGKVEGELEGIRKGELEGIRKGARGILLRLLHARFGEVPEGVEQRVKAAGEKELETWSLRVLTASTAEDVVA